MGDTDSPLRDDLEARLRFETLLVDLSAGFVNLPPDKVDGAVLDAQRRICECFDLDRSALWQTDGSDLERWWLTHFHQVPFEPAVTGGPLTERSTGADELSGRHSTPPVELRDDAATLFPWITAQMRRRETVIISNIDLLPAEASRDQALLRRIGTRATVLVPLVAGGVVTGALTFGAMRRERTWDGPLVNRLHLIAHVFAGALARKQAELRLRENEARLALAAAAGGTGLWELDLATGSGWASPEARDLYGFSPAEDTTVETILAKVHPDDRPGRREHLKKIAEEPSAYTAEYRVVKADGQVRWVHVRGRSFAASAGTPPKLLGVAIDITERKLAEDQLARALEELQRLRDQLRNENLYLREEAVGRQRQRQIAGQSPAIRRALAQAERVATTTSTVLLVGETGTGKERFAAVIHDLSPRRARPMVRVNCAAIPATLIESELFGREKGAYTGALSRQAGRFELAHGSTLFLDEIGDLPAEVQIKLLRVLQEKQIERLGSAVPIAVDVRIIAATNRDLEAAVREGRFREDLYYRLNVFPIAIPPLRERHQDIPLLTQLFVDEFAATMGKQIDAIAKTSMDTLVAYAWPGNVRELRNVIERAMILTTGPTLRIDIPHPHLSAPHAPSQELQNVERAHILAVLGQTGWRIRGAHGAAKILAMKPTTLETRMAKLGIRRPHNTSDEP